MNYFYAYQDECDLSKHIVVFATDEEIADDCILGEACDGGNLEEIDKILDDDGSMCEEYLMYTDKDIKTIRAVCEKNGFIWNDLIKDKGWG